MQAGGPDFATSKGGLSRERRRYHLEQILPAVPAEEKLPNRPLQDDEKSCAVMYSSGNQAHHIVPIYTLRCGTARRQSATKTEYRDYASSTRDLQFVCSVKKPKCIPELVTRLLENKSG